MPPPEKLDGTSLRPLVLNPDAAWDKPALTQVQRGKELMGYSLRTEKYRYTEWKNGEKRESKVVFIGRDLKEEEIRKGFLACAA